MHPAALGRPADEILAEMWDIAGPMLYGVLEGQPATWSVDQPLRLNRRGRVEESFFTYSYSPITDGETIGGVLLVNFETTERVLAERRLRTHHELAALTGKTQTTDEVCARAAEVLAANPSDVPFSLLYLADGEGRLRLSASTAVAQAPDSRRWPLREVASSRRPVLVEDVASRFLEREAGLPRAALLLPMPQVGNGTLSGCLVAGVSDFQALDDAYRSFLDLAAGQIATAVATTRVIEEERRRAKAIAELDAAKSAFFANVSHEFPTPLTLLLAPLEDTLAQVGDALLPADRERLTIAHHSALRLQKLVNMLLEFSRIEGGRVQAVREPTDLAAITPGLAGMFRSSIERAGMRLSVDCQPSSLLAAVDRNMWEKIVLNLLSNAFKFTYQGEIAVSLRQVGEEAELSVRDTGIGIPEDELPRMFDRFHQIQGARGRSAEGTGIGLALVHELVKLHGGSIKVESTYGQGSIFIVSMPLGPAVSAPDPRSAPPVPPLLDAGAYVAEATRWLPDLVQADVMPGPSLKGTEAAGPRSQEPSVERPADAKARVLVADDNADMRHYLRRLLESAYEVEAVTNGQSALAAALAHPPDLVLADVMMPELDGIGLLRALRADPRTSTVPVLLLSARAGEEARVEGMAAGADDYLVKPIGARELLARMRAHLTMVRIRREAARRESQLRAEVRLAQEQAAAILESITDGFIALDSDWRFTDVNAEAERISGIRRQDHIGKTLWELFPATLGTALESQWRRAMAERVAVDLENYYEPWDSWFHVKAYPSRDGGLSVFFHDITARKRSEEALRKSHSELEQHVRERTRELSLTNARLARQILKREQIEDARTELLRRLVRAHEEEYCRIARELHDDLTQRLAILAIDCATMEQLPACPLGITEGLRAMRERLVALSEGVHSLSRRLHPSILDDLGLVDTLRSECASLTQRHGIAVRFHTQDVPADLPQDVALCVYRVAQESLRNIARHSFSPSASVRITAAGGELVLCVRDHGVGFEVAARGKGGLGLESMRERARLLRARLAIRSRPGEGAKIVLRVPLERSEP